MIARRDIPGGALGLLAVPLAARAQAPGKLFRVGFLAPASESEGRHMVESFRRGLRDVGSTEGRHLLLNPKTAKALCLTIPPSILARADEVVE